MPQICNDVGPVDELIEFSFSVIRWGILTLYFEINIKHFLKLLSSDFLDFKICNEGY